MFPWKTCVFWTAITTAAVFLICSAVRYNLAAVSALTAPAPLTILLDAGHGGEDGGTVSADGTRESDLNLSVVLRLEQLLALCGLDTELIRRTDASVYTEGGTVSERKASDLKQRVRLVQETPNPILISIHQNHFPEPKYRGAQVFYAASPKSEALANLTQSALRGALDSGNKRQSKPADSVYLLSKVQCPAILVECGFLSNPAESALLQTEAYQIKLACAIGCGLAQFLEEEVEEVEIKSHFLLHSLRQ